MMEDVQSTKLNNTFPRGLRAGPAPLTRDGCLGHDGAGQGLDR